MEDENQSTNTQENAKHQSDNSHQLIIFAMLYNPLAHGLSACYPQSYIYKPESYKR